MAHTHTHIRRHSDFKYNSEKNEPREVEKKNKYVCINMNKI